MPPSRYYPDGEGRDAFIFDDSSAKYGKHPPKQGPAFSRKGPGPSVDRALCPKPTSYSGHQPGLAEAFGKPSELLVATIRSGEASVKSNGPEGPRDELLSSADIGRFAMQPSPPVFFPATGALLDERARSEVSASLAEDPDRAERLRRLTYTTTTQAQLSHASPPPRPLTKTISGYQGHLPRTFFPEQPDPA
eukprot:tig00020780_g13798.t1